jgi:hypothetical protein
MSTTLTNIQQHLMTRCSTTTQSINSYAVVAETKATPAAVDTHKAFLKRKGIEMVSYSAAAANAEAMPAPSTRFAKSDMTDYEYLQATAAAKFEKQRRDVSDMPWG